MRTIETEFKAGIKSGKTPCDENTAKAVAAVTKRHTDPLVRSYWSGYLCQLTQDNASALSEV
jgi:hypothetical protein